MTEFATSAAPSRGGMRFKYILLLSLLAFAAGIAASWWLADRFGWLEPDLAAQTSPVAAPQTSNVAVPPAALVSPSPADPMAAIDNSARSEGLLVAFAARRAIDSGAPLGYLTDQLRLRFGSTQPQAVMTILQASQAPVTLQTLQSELTALDNLLVTGTREETFWATIKRESSELFVLRKADSASPAPTQRMLRTHALVESGNIRGAIAEISAMPGVSAPAAQNWLAKARSYDQTRKALDTLERSALAAAPILTSPVSAAPAAPVTPPVSELPQAAVPE
jgi:Mitochondrial inner membrane protein